MYTISQHSMLITNNFFRSSLNTGPIGLCHNQRRKYLPMSRSKANSYNWKVVENAPAGEQSANWQVARILQSQKHEQKYKFARKEQKKGRATAVQGSWTLTWFILAGIAQITLVMPVAWQICNAPGDKYAPIFTPPFWERSGVAGGASTAACWWKRAT